MCSMQGETNHMEISEFGTGKVLLQGHPRKLAAQDPQKAPELPEEFPESIFQGQVRGRWAQIMGSAPAQFSEWLMRRSQSACHRD